MSTGLLLSATVQLFIKLMPYYRLYKGLLHPYKVISYYSIFNAIPQAILKVTTLTY